jgi:hypothetical protein
MDLEPFSRLELSKKTKKQQGVWGLGFWNSPANGEFPIISVFQNPKLQTPNT